MRKRNAAIGIATVAIATAMATVCIGCTQSSQAPSDDSSEPAAIGDAVINASEDTAVKDGAVSEVEEGNTSTASTDLQPESLSETDMVIEFGDYDGMEALAKDIRNGEVAGKVIKIDGTVSNLGGGMSYNIVQYNQSNQGIGTTFVIEGVEEDAYPADGSRVSLTGIVTLEENGFVYTLHTLPEFVIVQV